MPKYSKKIGSDKTYKRPKKTYQDMLTNDEIAEKLQGYEKVDDITQVPVDTHIRYFSTDAKGNNTFRMGGFLKVKSDDYVILTNGKIDWSVQIKGTIFFKKMSQKDELNAIHQLYKKKLAEKDEMIKKRNKLILQLKKIIEKNNIKVTYKKRPDKQNDTVVTDNSQKSKPKPKLKPKPKPKSGSKISFGKKGKK